MTPKKNTTATRKPSVAELKNRTPLGGTPIPSKSLVATKPKSMAVAKPGKPADDYVSRYLDEVSPASLVGRMIKFGKDGKFITPDDGEEISEDTAFVVLADETLVGFVKFNGPGEPPDRVMGLLYGGFTMPARDSLGDLDQTRWQEGLDGRPSDPWQHQMYLVLQQADSKEMFTFVTGSTTGRRAVGNLLRHYDRLRRSNVDEVPVVRLRTGGYKHKDDRVGWVNTPAFIVFGKTSRDSAAKPDTSTEAVLNDSIPL
jgi:hypothetical protein